ncbi:MAG: hypothetical protein M1830_008920 [Pleopsidium flavum]|nr:MAG: hypothetical protein M1830_008920 [Pleopsidium flavum]
MVSRKRGRAEMESPEPAPDLGLLDEIRNMWEFANLMQYVFIFGKAVKINEDLDIEDLETECLKPGPSESLSDIGLALLKFVSSHRGLTTELFDEYTRRQYLAKAPSRNPFGTDETPRKFAGFDIFTKIRVLFQLSQWTLINADRIRERMPESKDTEQTQWRIEEIGYDKYDRLYFVLDDNRLYRRTDPTPPSLPAPKPKANSKKGKAAARASKRRKTAEVEGSADEHQEEAPSSYEDNGAPGDRFGGRKWECLAITLSQYENFLESIRKSKDSDERFLHKRITEEVLPVIVKAEEDQQRKNARREKELLTLQKLATAKRSSRIASKLDREREEQEAAEVERKRRATLIEGGKEQERQKKMEEARESRMMTREQRLKEREYKRLLHEEELANLSEDSKKLETGEARMSERHLKAEMEKRKIELEKLAEDDEWFFDCSVCGVHGDNLDDGSHSVACELCNVWQHSACLGISQASAEKDDFHFICRDCERRKEDAKKPKIPTLKFRIGSSSSPPSDKMVTPHNHGTDSNKRYIQDHGAASPSPKRFKHVEIHSEASPPRYIGQSTNGQSGLLRSIMDGPTLSPQGQLPMPSLGQNGHVSPPTHPPPGLASPPGSQPTSNGYRQYHEDAPFTHQRAPSSHLMAENVNAVVHHGHSSPGVAWLTGGAPPQHRPETTGNLPRPATAYAPQNPFLNSFDRQRPSSSHSNHSNHNLPSPIKNRPSMSPTQGGKDVGPIAFPQPGSPSGSFPPPHAAQNTVLSPTKHSSPPVGLLHSSSPVTNPPLPASAFSPTKHSPPRPSSNHGMAGTHVMPPVTSLSPSPRQQDFTPPHKVGTFQQARTNGRVTTQ